MHSREYEVTESDGEKLQAVEVQKSSWGKAQCLLTLGTYGFKGIVRGREWSGTIRDVMEISQRVFQSERDCGI